MKNPFVPFKFKNGGVMNINVNYITAFAYVESRDETTVAILGESKEIYFPGNQLPSVFRTLASLEK